VIDEFSELSDYMKTVSGEQLEKVIAEVIKKETGFPGNMLCRIASISFNKDNRLNSPIEIKLSLERDMAPQEGDYVYERAKI
jgi:hypothetical protein